jgi:hypothetical protein
MGDQEVKSVVPSPFRSPVPATDQPELAPSEPMVFACVSWPFVDRAGRGIINQDIGVPSPLESPVPTTDQPEFAPSEPRLFARVSWPSLPASTIFESCCLYPVRIVTLA